MKVVVTGIPAFNGDYPVALDNFTMRELNIIKRLAGVRSGELSEAFQARDTDLILAVGVIAVRRSGKDWETFEKIAWDTPLGGITLDVDEQDDTGTAGDAVPLTPLNPPDSSVTGSERLEPSGPPSSDGGESHPEKNLRAIGGQG